MGNFRYALCLFLSILLFVHCNKNEPKNLNEMEYSGDTISIDEVIAFVPDYLFKPTSLIYKNASGESLELKTVSLIEIKKRKIDNVESVTESFEIRLYSESNEVFNITLAGSGMAWTDGSIVKSLNVVLMPFYPGGDLYLEISFRGGKVENDLGSPSEIPSLELLGRSFDRIFKAKNEDSNVYSEIYFSPIDGVIAFRDESNDLWVLDEVIE